MVRIEQQQKVLVLGALAGTVADLRSGSIQEHPERPHPAAGLPILCAHPLPVRSEPDDVLVGMGRIRVTIVERMPVEVWMLLAVLSDPAREIEERLAAPI